MKRQIAPVASPYDLSLFKRPLRRPRGCLRKLHHSSRLGRLSLHSGTRWNVTVARNSARVATFRGAQEAFVSPHSIFNPSHNPIQAVNLVFCCALIFGILVLFYQSSREVELKILRSSQQIMSDAQICAEEFHLHGCDDRSQLGIYFRKRCNEWQMCKDRDPKHVGSVFLTIETWAKVFDMMLKVIGGNALAVLLLAAGVVVAFKMPFSIDLGN